MITTARRRLPRTAMGWARALLLLSLLLGIGAMHTLGHPPGDAHGSSGVSAVAGDHAEAASGQVEAASGGVVQAGADTGSDAEPPAMDPTSMCLAIVTMAIALLGLCAAVFTPWPGRLLRAARAALPSAVPDAPPLPPCLAKLQVLRI